MIVQTLKYKRPAGIVGQLSLSKVYSLRTYELAVIGAWIKDLTEGSEVDPEALKYLLAGKEHGISLHSGDYYLTKYGDWLIVNNADLDPCIEPYITESK